MALEIIGPGFGRTGSASLKRALEILGFGPCHHMEEIFAHPEQVPHWEAVAAGSPVDWDAVFAGYRSQVDWPGAHVWRELAAYYPESKVVLSIRPESLRVATADDGRPHDGASFAGEVVRHTFLGRLMRYANQAKASTTPPRIKNMTPIADRPFAADDRTKPGHWEGIW